MEPELQQRIINHIPTPYSYGWDEESAYFAPPLHGIDSCAEDEVIAQNYVLNNPEIGQLAYELFMSGMKALLTCCEKAREEQELAAMEAKLDKYEEYESKFNSFGNCVGSRKLASIEYLAEPVYRHKPRKGKARKERFTRKTHNASRGRLIRCEE